MSRAHLVAGAAALSLVASIAVSGAAWAGEAPPNLEGFWRLRPAYRVNNDRPEPGRDGLPRDWMLFGSYKLVEMPAFTPEAMQRVKNRINEEMAGRTLEDRTRDCLPGGFYDMMTFGNVEILQRERDIVFVIDWTRARPRHVYIGTPHPPASVLADRERTMGGDARGRWEGDTLVVDAIHISPDPLLFLVDFLTVSDQLHVQERYRLEEGGKVLATQWTFTDPKTFTRPWTVKLKYDRMPDTTEPDDLVCTPNARAE